MVNIGEWVVTCGFCLPLEQQSPVSQEESPRGTGEVKQHHQHPVHCHPQEGKELMVARRTITGNSIICIPNKTAIWFLLLSYFNSKSNWFTRVMSKLHQHYDLLQEMSHKDLQTIENIKWDPPYDPASGWKKSSINVKNYGRMIHSSKVRFRFLHCQVSGAK